MQTYSEVETDRYRYERYAEPVLRELRMSLGTQFAPAVE